MRYVGRGVFVASAMGLSASVLCAGVGQAQVSTTYTYDALGRLKTVTNAGGATVTYAYDAAGNRSQVVVAGAQTAPAAFDLGSPVTGATAGAWVLSASPVVSGFTGAAAISVTGGEYRINGGSWQTAAGTVSAGQSVQVRVQAPATAGASQTATLNIAGVTDTFQVTTAAAADTTPNAYDLGGPVTAAAGAWSSSNTVTIAGIDAAAPVSISGGQYRINGGAWTTASGTVTAAQTIQVQVQASATAGASQTATLNVGGVTDTFQVTTAAADTTPDAATFQDITINSNDPDVGWIGTESLVTGINQPLVLRIERYNYSGDLDAAYIDYQVFDAAGTMVDSGYYQVRGSDYQYKDVTVQNGYRVKYFAHGISAAGRRSGSWNMTVWRMDGSGVKWSERNVSVTVDADNNYNVADTTPDAYDLGGPLTGASGAWSTSNTVTVAGINAATPVSISGGQYRINGGAWTSSSGTITNGQTIQVQVQAPTTGGASQTATLNVGGVTDTFQVTTAADYTLDALNWTNISESSSSTNLATGGNGLALSGVNSNIDLRGTISGLSGTLSAGSRLEMWVNGSMRYHSTNLGNGSWAGGQFAPGENVQFVVRAVSADGAQRSGSYTVTVQNITTGQTVDTFTVNQTAAVPLPDTTPNAYDLGAAVSGAAGAWSSSATVTVSGINAAAAVSIAGGQYRINGGTWTSSAGTITNGQTIQIRVQAPTAAGASQTATLNVGGVTDTFQVTTAADYTLDALNWTNISESSSSTNLATGGNGLALSGVNSNIDLRGTISGLSGTLSAGSRLEMWVNGSMRYHSTNLGNGSWAGGQFAPGENVQFVARAVSADGAQRSGSYTVTVQNITTGQAVDTFTVGQTAAVAAADYTPDAFSSFTDQTAVTNDPTVSFGPSQTVTGINQPIVLRVERYNYSGNLDEIYVHVYRDAGSGWVYQGTFDPRDTSNYQYVDVSVTNGNKIRYTVEASTVEGRKTGTMNMVVWNQSQPGGGVQLSSRTVNITVDNDNNYYGLEPCVPPPGQEICVVD
ncbi:beta strand repeat-containing protein [Brevundimonas sp. SL130]|uniref:beta strand repeat-containing protein n=1 Tax=Brevundimonas sp. SL130 TaxID=2995143 RepID=UPI00226D01BF|nr:hypothetical protein [Brevundimonas sp. SL130]WAC59785.1 hypothetical protein OU998_16510 [Brevundimonas sp. SL130]